MRTDGHDEAYNLVSKFRERAYEDWQHIFGHPFSLFVLYNAQNRSILDCESQTGSRLDVH
jgi:hypothetical protein